MTQIEIKTKKNLAKLVARSYNILCILYRGEPKSISEIAQTLADSPANVSRIIAELQEQALIVTREESEKGESGRPRKICSLTHKAQRIVEVFEETLKPGLGDSQISTLIAMMEDKTLSPETREVAAGTLYDHASSISEFLLKNEKIRTMFKQAVSNYSSKEEEMEKSTLSILSASLPYIILNQETASWFYETLYDAFLKTAQDPKAPKPLREYAINTLSRTARLSNHPAIISRTINALLSLHFKNQDPSNAIKNEFLKFEPKLQLQIIEKIREYAKNEDQRTTAEDLLRILIKNWWGKDLSRAAASTYQESVKQ